MRFSLLRSTNRMQGTQGTFQRRIQPSVVKGTDIIDSGQLIVVACGVQPFDVGSNPGFVVLPNRSLLRTACGFATRRINRPRES